VQVEDANDVITYDQSAIPCEFCLELFDEHTIAEHQVSVPAYLQYVILAEVFCWLLKSKTDTE